MNYGTKIADGQPMTFNRKKSTCPHMAVIGAAGSGKRRVLMSEITQVINDSEDDIIVIDEYKCDMEGLKNVILDTETLINPLDIVFNDYIDDTSLFDAIDIVMTIFETLLKRALSPYERSVVDRAMNVVFKDFIDNLDKQHKYYNFENNPTIKDVLDSIRNLEGDTDFVRSLEGAAKPYARQFSGKTNISYHDRIHLCIGNSSQLTTQIYNVLAIAFAMNKTKINYLEKDKLKYTWIYFNDVQSILCEEPIAVLFQRVHKTTRLWGGIVTIGFSTYECNFYQNTILNHVDVIQLLRIPFLDAHHLAKMLDLSKEETEYIRYCNAGEGLFITSKDKQKVTYNN